MKYLLLLLLATTAKAQQGITNVHEVALTTTTITQTISLCAANGADDVTARTSSGTLAGAFAIETYNPASSTNTINCGTDVSVSSAISSVWYGREIPAGTGVYWAVPPGTRKTRCVTQNSAGGCTQITVSQFK